VFGHAMRRLTRFSAAQPAAVDGVPVRPARPVARRLALACALLLLSIPLALGGVAALALRWDGIYPGLRAGASDLGGLDRPTAALRLAGERERWEQQPITLTGPTGTTSLTRRELGLNYDLEGTLGLAVAHGREADRATRLGAIVDLALGGRELGAAYWVDDGLLRARLAALAGTTDIAPRDGDLRIEAGRVVVIPPVEGRGLDIDAAVALLIGGVGPYGATSLDLPVAENIQPRVNAAALAEVRARAEALLASPIHLRGDDLDLTFDAAAIGPWLAIRHNNTPGAAPLALDIERARVRSSIAPLAGRVRRDTGNASYDYDEQRRAFIVTAPAVEGRQLDVDRTVAAVLAALDHGGDRGGDRIVAPVAERWAPGLTGADIASANRRADKTYLAGPIAFSDGAQRWLLTVPELARWLTILPGKVPADGPRLVFDEAALVAYIAGMQGRIDRPARDATYTMDAGSDVYRVTAPSQVGRALDTRATLQAALATLTDGKPGHALLVPIADVRPKMTEADVAALVPERWIDMDLTTQRMHAVVGKKVVHTAIVSSGKKGWETPTGTYHIMYRVENETMTSESIGAEENYRLENVLYTQYFTNEGHALHYSWWKTPESFGKPSSHGCLSETLRDAEYFWQFAGVGTRVTIRGVSPT